MYDIMWTKLRLRWLLCFPEQLYASVRGCYEGKRHVVFVIARINERLFAAPPTKKPQFLNFSKKISSLIGGSLGLWIDEERSQMRYVVRTADTLSTKILNAHCAIGFYPLAHLAQGRK